MSTPSADTPVLDLVTQLNTASIERSKLDPSTLMLVRIAALVAVDAPPISYLTNIGVAGDVGVEGDDVQEVLIAVAPIVGTARVASAAGKMVRALGLAIAVADSESEERADGAE